MKTARNLVCPGLACILIVVAASSFATAQGKRDCGGPPASPSAQVPVPGHPFGALPSADGCWLFSSLTSSNPKSVNGIAVLKRTAGKYSLERVVTLEASPTGLALTHDGKLLIVADDEFVVFLDVARLTSGQGDPIAGYMETGRGAGTVYVNATADDGTLFTSDENLAQLTVIDLAKARANGFDKSAIVGRIEVGNAPIALTFSPDGKWLYTTSQIARRRWNWQKACKPEGQDPATAQVEEAEGGITVIDVAKAKTSPAESVVVSYPAGCTPVRLGISDSGDSVWITVRNSNAVYGFDTAKLRANDPNARIANVAVGPSPVGLAVIDGGKRVVISNSNRFAKDPNSPQTLMVIDAELARGGKNAVAGTIPAGSFPREFGKSADGKTLFVSNYLSNTIQIMDATHLPMETK
jgi:DNA-binding beta-propeller fold protein YncE